MDALKHIYAAEAVRDILKSDGFPAYPMIEVYESIQSKTGLDFNASLRLLRCLPLFLAGQRHQHVRKGMAVRLASVQAAQRSAVKREVKAIAAIFVPGAEIDLIGGVALPLWRATSQCILPREGDLATLIENITTLFYPTLSLRKRLQINDGIQRFIDRYGDEAGEELIMLSMAALGARPFVGSFALSLYDIAVNAGARPLSQIDWPAALPSSSLRFVDRTVAHDTTRHGQNFKAGDRLRCHTHESIYQGHSNVEALFGYGAHVCLGRTISEFCWRTLGESLGQLNVTLLPVTCRMDTHTEPFTMPVVATVRVA